MAKVVDCGWYEPKENEPVMVGMTTTNKVPASFAKAISKSNEETNATDERKTEEQ